MNLCNWYQKLCSLAGGRRILVGAELRVCCCNRGTALGRVIAGLSMRGSLAFKLQTGPEMAVIFHARLSCLIALVCGCCEDMYAREK